jgi:hypothetical protein
MRTLVIAAVMFATTSAAADPPRYSRKQPLVVPVKLSERVKPKAAAKSDPARPLSADAVLVIKDRQQPLRREQERILEKLVKDAPDDDPEKPDYMFRLAEHYAQQLQFWRIKTVEEQLGK